MAQQQLNNQESAYTFRTKLNANFSDLYLNKAQSSHASATSAYGLGTTSLFGHVRVTAANGLTISGGTISLNSASTSAPGAVQLNDTLTSTSTTTALTANQGKVLKDTMVVTYSGTGAPDNSLGKNGDIYIKTT